jgi:transketolase
VPGGVREHFEDGVARRGRGLHQAWVTLFKSYRGKYPDLADRLQRMETQAPPDRWDDDLPVFAADAKGLASRDSSAKVLNAIAPRYPWLIGGAADLAPSRRASISKARAIWNTTVPAAAICILAYASTPWERS